MCQAVLSPNLTKKFQWEVSQIANNRFPLVMLLGGLSVNLNHLKKDTDMEENLEFASSILTSRLKFTTIFKNENTCYILIRIASNLTFVCFSFLASSSENEEIKSCKKFFPVHYTFCAVSFSFNFPQTKQICRQWMVMFLHVSQACRVM